MVPWAIMIDPAQVRKTTRRHPGQWDELHHFGGAESVF